MCTPTISVVAPEATAVKPLAGQRDGFWMVLAAFVSAAFLKLTGLGSIFFLSAMGRSSSQPLTNFPGSDEIGAGDLNRLSFGRSTEPMQKDQEKWNARYLAGQGSADPSSVVVAYWGLAPTGRALDIACGKGRNSLFLADKGFAVDAVDISGVAIDSLAGKHPNIDAIRADLDVWPIPQNRYTLIVNVRFLDRRLFPMILGGLRPGGVLIFESFLSKTPNAYCLTPDELLRVFPTMRIVHYEEHHAGHSERFDQIATLVAIREHSASGSSDQPR